MKISLNNLRKIVASVLNEGATFEQRSEAVAQIMYNLGVIDNENLEQDILDIYKDIFENNMSIQASAAPVCKVISRNSGFSPLEYNEKLDLWKFASCVLKFNKQEYYNKLNAYIAKNVKNRTDIADIYKFTEDNYSIYPNDPKYQEIVDALGGIEYTGLDDTGRDAEIKVIAKDSILEFEEYFSRFTRYIIHTLMIMSPPSYQSVAGNRDPGEYSEFDYMDTMRRRFNTSNIQGLSGRLSKKYMSSLRNDDIKDYACFVSHGETSLRDSLEFNFDIYIKYPCKLKLS